MLGYVLVAFAGLCRHSPPPPFFLAMHYLVFIYFCIYPVVFFGGRGCYKMRETAGNVMVEVVKCMAVLMTFMLLSILLL